MRYEMMRDREELHVSTHPSAQAKAKAKAKAGLGLHNNYFLGCPKLRSSCLYELI